MADKELVTLAEPMAIAEVEEKIKGMTALVEGTQVTTDKELEAVADIIKNIKVLGKFVRQEMEKYTKPAQEIINTARLKFLPYEKECTDAEATLKKKAQVYMDAEEAKRKKAEDKIAADLESGKIKQEATAIRKMEEVGEEQKSVSTGSAQMSRKIVKKAYIVDAEKIPHEYWVVDEVRVKKAALAGAIIPGVEIREESEMAIR